MQRWVTFQYTVLFNFFPLFLRGLVRRDLQMGAMISLGRTYFYFQNCLSSSLDILNTTTGVKQQSSSSYSIRKRPTLYLCKQCASQACFLLCETTLCRRGILFKEDLVLLLGILENSWRGVQASRAFTGNGQGKAPRVAPPTPYKQNTSPK